MGAVTGLGIARPNAFRRGRRATDVDLIRRYATFEGDPVEPDRDHELHQPGCFRPRVEELAGPGGSPSSRPA
jgi:hypothetical protein